MITIIRLPNGQEISSGAPSGTAIRSANVAHRVNEGQDLALGSCCASSIDIKLFAPDGPPVTAGDEITVFYQMPDGTRQQVGLYAVTKPTISGPATYRIQGYDRITRLDQDLSDWLASLPDWPYRLETLARMVCARCGLQLVNSTLTNGSYPVQRLQATQITGRQLMRWISQIACSFCVATPTGEISLGWYTPAPIGVSADGSTGTWYYQGSLRLQDYQVAPIDKVQIQLTGDDVGTIWPAQPAGTNTYKVSGNYLLSATSAQALQGVAETIYNHLQGTSYTPAAMAVPAASGLRAGQLIQITDGKGQIYLSCIMATVRSGDRLQISCTGNPDRASVAAVNNASYKQIFGKVLELRTDVDGLRAENRDAQGNLAALELQVGSIRSTVQSNAEQTAGDLQALRSQLEQTANAVDIRIQQVVQNGVEQVITTSGYRFDADGLLITQSGREITNRITNQGMYVTRSGTTMLRADAAGVKATDLQAVNYLIIGQNSRLEDYTDKQGGRRTACFYIGGDA